MKTLVQLCNLPVRTAAALLVVVAVGCATAPPGVDTGGEPTHDGLYAVKNSRADEAWARPGFDLSRYDKIMLEDAGIEYRPGGDSSRTTVARSRSAGPYEVTQEQKSRLESVLMQAFHQELGRSEVFEIVNEPGPEVLLVRGSLLDVVSNVPPEPVGVTDIYLTSVGEASLVIELRDSVTNAILARAVDRRAAERPGGNLFESNRVTNTTEVRRLAQTWASVLRVRLEELMSESTGNE
jgi:hypothetical protein